MYETFDSILGQVKQAIKNKEPTLELYEEHIKPIVMKRWNTMNTPLHMAAYAVNPKWYAPRLGRVPPSANEEVKEGFFNALSKMYNAKDGAKIWGQWLDFSNLCGPTFGRSKARTDRATLAQKDPIGWWTWHGRDAPELKALAVCLLSQVASSSSAERNWSTYSLSNQSRGTGLPLDDRRSLWLFTVYCYYKSGRVLSIGRLQHYVGMLIPRMHCRLMRMTHLQGCLVFRWMRTLCLPLPVI